MRWAIITGEYPPQPGGVSDYSRLVARGLAEAGDEVHVWAPACPQPSAPDPNVYVHPLPGRFGLRALSLLDYGLKRLPRPYRILVQYVPQSFGWMGMNAAFCLWLHSRRRYTNWIMFHEVLFPLGWAQPLKHQLLGIITRFMASLVVRPADRVFVAIPAWETCLRQLAPVRRPISWLPVPSNVPTTVLAEAVAKVRSRYCPDPDVQVVGHFGTFAPHTTALLNNILPALVSANVKRVGLLIGRGGERYKDGLEQDHPSLRGRLHAPGPLAGEEISALLAACDVLVQPYPDGASSRRGSLMAGLALGLPVVTNSGTLSEPLWQASQAVSLVRAFSSPLFVTAAEALLANAACRADLGRRAASLYANRFSLARTIQTLRSELPATSHRLGR